MGGVPIKKNGRYDRCDRYGRYGGYDALKNASHVVRLDEQSKDPKRSPESPQPMSDAYWLASVAMMYGLLGSGCRPK